MRGDREQQPDREQQVGGPLPGAVVERAVQPHHHLRGGADVGPGEQVRRHRLEQRGAADPDQHEPVARRAAAPRHHVEGERDEQPAGQGEPGDALAPHAEHDDPQHRRGTRPGGDADDVGARQRVAQQGLADRPETPKAAPASRPTTARGSLFSITMKLAPGISVPPRMRRKSGMVTVYVPSSTSTRNIASTATVSAATVRRTRRRRARCTDRTSAAGRSRRTLTAPLPCSGGPARGRQAHPGRRSSRRPAPRWAAARAVRRRRRRPAARLRGGPSGSTHR